MPIFDFECGGGHAFERFIKSRNFLPLCPICKREDVERIWTPTGRAGGEAGSEYPKTTKDITGEPVTFSDAAAERAFLKEHNERTGENIRLRDDAAFLDKTHEGLDWKTGQPIYAEGTGQGLKGTWGGLGPSHPEMIRLQGERYDDEED